MTINQGDVYWIELGDPVGSEPGYRHPHVVIQSNIFNESRINTVIVCVLTSNLSRAAIPGNVQLAAGEAQLPKASVVNVTQIFTVDKSDLGEKIGTLPPQRIRQILQGINLVLEPTDPDGASD